MRPVILDGDVLRVPSSRFYAMQLAILRAPDSDKGSWEALKMAGLLPTELRFRMYRETRIVIDDTIPE